MYLIYIHFYTKDYRGFEANVIYGHEKYIKKRNNVLFNFIVDDFYEKYSHSNYIILTKLEIFLQISLI